MTDRDAMLAAHVRFELDRWAADPAGEVASAVAMALRGLAETPAADLVDDLADDVAEPGRLADLVDRATADPRLAEATAALLSDLAALTRDRLSEDETPIGDLVGREAYDRVADTVIGLEGLRARVIEQVTTSEVYSRLLAHVLYHGLKGYALSENLVARKVPGASSLLRLGQSALSSSGLEKGIDRQLTAFVNANIQDTIRESRHYLEQALNEEVLRAVADEVWAANAGTTVGEAVAWVPESAVDDGLAAAAAAWSQAGSDGRALRLLESIVPAGLADLAEALGDRTVGDLLDEAGLTPQSLGQSAGELARPLVARLLAEGILEDYLRQRLAAFYDTWFAGTPEGG